MSKAFRDLATPLAAPCYACDECSHVWLQGTRPSRRCVRSRCRSKKIRLFATEQAAAQRKGTDR